MKRNKNKSLFSKEKIISKLIFGVVMAVVSGLVFGPAIQAQFMRQTGDTGYGYGYGYGYGVGYGFDSGATAGYKSDFTYSATNVDGYGFGYGYLIDDGSGGSTYVEASDRFDIVPDNISSLVTAGILVPNGSNIASTTFVTFKSQVKITIGSTTITIPDDTVLTASSASDFSALASTATVTTTGLPSNYSSAGAIQFGLPAVGLTSDNDITVDLNVGDDYSGDLTVYHKTPGGSWEELTTCTVSSGVCQFTTTSLSEFSATITVPTVTSVAASSLGSTTATLNGNITALGGESASARGFQYGLTDSYGSTAASSGSSFSTGAFSENLTGLTCGVTTYHYRAYATNTAGTVYGSDLTFDTGACSPPSSSGSSGSVVVVVPEETTTEEETTTTEETTIEDITVDAPVTTDGVVSVDPTKGGKTTLTTTTGAKVQIIVPVSAVSASTNVTVVEVAEAVVATVAPVPAGKSIVGEPYSVQALQGTTVVETFAKDVSLEFTYTDDQIAGLSESSLKVYYWNGNMWVALASTVNTATNTVTAGVDHMTYFTVMGTPEVVAEGTTALTYSNGSLLSVKGDPTVWLIEDSLRKGIPSAGVFESRFKWQEIIEILSVSILEEYEIGDSIKYPDGTIIMGSDKTVYIVADNGKKRGVTSATVFEGLGYSWDNIVAVSDAELATYSTGNVISVSTSHPSGALVNVNGTVFQIDSSYKLRGIPTPNVFETNLFSWDNLVTATDADKALTVGANLSFPDGTIIRETGTMTVFVVADGQKRGFTSATAFEGLGYKWDNIVEGTSVELATLTAGSVIE